MAHIPVLLTYEDQPVSLQVVLNSDSIITPHMMSDMDKCIWAALLWMKANKMSNKEFIEHDKRDDYISSLWVSFYGDVSGFCAHTTRPPMLSISYHQESLETTVSYKDPSCNITFCKDARHAVSLIAQSPYYATYHKAKTTKNARETGEHAAGTLSHFCDEQYGHMMGLVVSAAMHLYAKPQAWSNISPLLMAVGLMGVHHDALCAQTLKSRIVDMDFQGLLVSSGMMRKTHWSQGNMTPAGSLVDMDIDPRVRACGEALADLMMSEDKRILWFLCATIDPLSSIQSTVSAHEKMRVQSIIQKGMSLVNALPSAYEMALPQI